jgi:predicted dehydrogenase
MLNIGLVGAGKMGISHLAILNAHPKVRSVAVCESSGYVRSVLEKYCGLRTYDSFAKLLDAAGLDAVVLATPSRMHARMVRDALDRGLHVFCEKPFCLDPRDSRELAELAKAKRLANQVGYHYRFVGAFNEAKRLIDAGSLGRVHHIRVEAYGPVALRPKGGTWRARGEEGGGCLYDYACHAVDLMNYLVGPPRSVSGAVMNRIFSTDVDDEVYATLSFDDGSTGQIAANWSDESFRRMSTLVSVWGTNGRIIADRQEIKTYIRRADVGSAPLASGWRTRYTTELTQPIDFYLRGEEYSAQIDHFVDCVERGAIDTRSSFAEAARTDEAVAMIRRAADRTDAVPVEAELAPAARRPKPIGLWNRARALLS